MDKRGEARGRLINLIIQRKVHPLLVHLRRLSVAHRGPARLLTLLGTVRDRVEWQFEFWDVFFVQLSYG